MYYFEKTVRPDYTLPIAIDINTHYVQKRTTCFFAHNHDVLEILLVLKGTLFITVNKVSRALSAGDIAIANPFEMHQGECDSGETEYLGITTNLRKILPYAQTSLSSSVSDLLSGKSRFKSFLSRDDSDAKLLTDLFLRLQSTIQDKSPAGECTSAGIVFQMFATLFQNHYIAGQLSLRGQRDLEFSRRVSQYLYENYEKDISTRTVCDHLYMEISQFCHKFREHFGCSFSNYLRQYRITTAANLYRGTELPISRIALNVGFSDYCYFSKSFKKYTGQSPAVYFRKWKSSED